MASPAPEFHPGTSPIPALDGVRAVAALQVMVLHFTTLPGISPALRRLSLPGQGGVDLFFVLSGFLITRILLSTRGAEGFFSRFYIRRALRILPLYVAFLAIYFFVRPPLLGLPTPPFSAQIWSWLFLENLPLTFPGLMTAGPNHYWSLAVEEHFYLLWPLLVSFCSREALRKLLWIALLAAPVSRILLFRQGLPVDAFTPCRMDGLALGALLACHYLPASVGSARSAWTGRIVMAVTAPLLVLLFLAHSGSNIGWVQVLKHSLIPLFYAGVLLCALSDPAGGALRGMLSSAPLRWLGRISYGLYVLHPLTVIAIEHSDLLRTRLWAAFIAFAGGTVLVAWLSYRFFEAPILGLRKRYDYGTRA